MKLIPCLCLGLFLAAATPALAVANASADATAANSAKLAPGFALREEPHTVVARDDGVRVWQQIKYLTNFNLAVPRVEIITNHYTELGAGICFQQPDGTWTDSQARFVLNPDGSVEATEIPHKVRISPDLHSIAAVQMTLPDGRDRKSVV